MQQQMNALLMGFDVFFFFYFLIDSQKLSPFASLLPSLSPCQICAFLSSTTVWRIHISTIETEIFLFIWWRYMAARIRHLWCEADTIRILAHCQRSDTFKIYMQQLLVPYNTIPTQTAMQRSSTQCKYFHKLSFFLKFSISVSVSRFQYSTVLIHLAHKMKDAQD